jgi:hypothetical protein
LTWRASGFCRTEFGAISGKKENTMKLAMLGGVVAICAATAIVAAQQPAPAETQTIIGCLKGEGTAQSPWMLTGVVIPPPAPAGRGGGGGRGAGRGGGAGAPAAGREGGGPPPAAAAPAPPAPPPAPIDVRIAGMDMTPWRGYRVQIEGALSPAGGARTITAASARSVYNTCNEK